MKVYRIAAIPGDGIGKEVVPAGQKVLEALANIDESFGFEFENFDWGGDYSRQHGVMMPDDGLDALRDKDATCSDLPATPISPITSRCGACASRFARDSTSMPTCGRRACFRASKAR